MADRDAHPTLLDARPWKPREWTIDEYEALPESDPETRGCPSCGGRHFSCVNTYQRHMPPIYRCNGTEWPNADDFEYRPPCGTLFRGRPGSHYDAEWFAVESVGVFLRRVA